ncbi:DUF3891 family protein [Oceanobacillus kimchii]|uniref:DUF3891 family protein n=2 Tax=Oceanobacillus kimchii TaxID=746691 RepID=UPI0003461F72|nr:DUF3891 family protein [Oceanobacillus kimchii]
MIVREREDELILITQDDHAQISGDILDNWNLDHFQGEEWRDSVLYAAYQHDLGWKEFDRQPFWNDVTNQPYTFADFPNVPKTVLYKYGINEVEKVDLYAALLCSEHYKRFLANNTSLEAQAFVEHEETRQERIIGTLPNFNKRLFEFHYGLLQISDNLSLFACMNEPGATGEKQHPFFKKGIPTNHTLHHVLNEQLQINWQNEDTIVMDNFPFDKPFPISIQYKQVSRQKIQQHGLVEAYEQATLEQHPVLISSPSHIKKASE